MARSPHPHRSSTQHAFLGGRAARVNATTPAQLGLSWCFLCGVAARVSLTSPVQLNMTGSETVLLNCWGLADLPCAAQVKWTYPVHVQPN